MKYTKEKCIEIASNYLFVKDWQANDVNSYVYAWRMGWLNECKAHMVNLVDLRKLSREYCIEISLNYSSIGELKKHHKNVYYQAYYKGWLDECTAHMNRKARKNTKSIEPKKNIKKKLHKPKVKNTLKSQKVVALISKIIKDDNKMEKRNFSDWLNCNNRKSIEKEKIIPFVEKRARKENTTRTLEDCKKIALQFSNIKEWKINDINSYVYAWKKGWLKECVEHMNHLKNTYSFTKEQCMEEAIKYPSRYEWIKANIVMYRYANYNGWLPDCTIHMGQQKRGIKSSKKLNKEECMEKSLNFSNVREWKKTDKNFYLYVLNKGWLKECVDNIISFKRNKKQQIEPQQSKKCFFDKVINAFKFNL